jgi:hypothetical protein
MSRADSVQDPRLAPRHTTIARANEPLIVPGYLNHSLAQPSHDPEVAVGSSCAAHTCGTSRRTVSSAHARAGYSSSNKSQNVKDFHLWATLTAPTKATMPKRDEKYVPKRPRGGSAAIRNPRRIVLTEPVGRRRPGRTRVRPLPTAGLNDPDASIRAPLVARGIIETIVKDARRDSPTTRHHSYRRARIQSPASEAIAHPPTSYPEGAKGASAVGEPAKGEKE